MKSSSTVQTGNIGESALDHQFKKLGWHVAPNPAGEVGIDLLLQPRTSEQIDPGALVGGQVKTGSSFFADAKKDADGNIVGWWFRDPDSRHVKYWLDYAVPVILFLHDEVTDKSYWVHVTKDSVESTGRGAKILVPATSTVDMDHAGELLEIATNGRISSQWEGSVWGGVEVLAADRFRYALLTPRLVAPHPNLKVSELLPDQAVALLIKMRLENLTPRAETGITSTTEDEPAPDLEQCRKSVDWGWRFYATLYDNLLGDADPDSLRTILDEAGTPYERAAAAVFACALLVEEANPRAGGP